MILYCKTRLTYSEKSISRRTQKHTNSNLVNEGVMSLNIHSVTQSRHHVMIRSIIVRKNYHKHKWFLVNIGSFMQRTRNSLLVMYLYYGSNSVLDNPVNINTNTNTKNIKKRQQLYNIFVFVKVARVQMCTCLCVYVRVCTDRAYILCSIFLDFFRLSLLAVASRKGYEELEMWPLFYLFAFVSRFLSLSLV